MNWTEIKEIYCELVNESDVFSLPFHINLAEILDDDRNKFQQSSLFYHN